jgi:hypothetical protein
MTTIPSLIERIVPNRRTNPHLGTSHWVVSRIGPRRAVAHASVALQRGPRVCVTPPRFGCVATPGGAVPRVAGCCE